MERQLFTLLLKWLMPLGARHAHGRKQFTDTAIVALPENPLWVCGQPASFGQALLAKRDSIERKFGFLVNFGGGLAPLPNWVRTPHRIAVWIHANFSSSQPRDIQQHRHFHR